MHARRVIPERQSMQYNSAVCRRLKKHLVDLLKLYDHTRDKELSVLNMRENGAYLRLPRKYYLVLENHENDLKHILVSNAMDMGFHYGKVVKEDTPQIRYVRAELLHAAVRVSTRTLDLMISIGRLKDECRRAMSPRTPCEICYEFDTRLDTSVECPRCKHRVCYKCSVQIATEAANERPSKRKCPFCRFEPEPRVRTDLVDLSALFDFELA